MVGCLVGCGGLSVGLSGGLSGASMVSGPRGENLLDVFTGAEIWSVKDVWIEVPAWGFGDYFHGRATVYC